MVRFLYLRCGPPQPVGRISGCELVWHARGSTFALSRTTDTSRFASWGISAPLARTVLSFGDSTCDVGPCAPTHGLLMLSVAGMSPPSALAIGVNITILSDDCQQFYRLRLTTCLCQEDLCAEYPVRGRLPWAVCAWHVTRRRSPTPWSVERLGWRCAWWAAPNS